MLWNSPSPVFEQQYPPVSGRLIKKKKKTQAAYNRCFELNCSPTLQISQGKDKNKQAAWQRRTDDACEWPSAQWDRPAGAGPEMRHWPGTSEPRDSARRETHQSSPPVTLQHDSRAAGQLSKMAISLQTSWRDVSFYYGGNLSLALQDVLHS